MGSKSGNCGATGKIGLNIRCASFREAAQENVVLRWSVHLSRYLQ